MTRILALDCATEACSAALLVDDEITGRWDRRAREHGPTLVAMTGALLAEATLGLDDLDALAFGCGPGSFTGLRIAAGITQGLALTAQLPVLPVSNLAILAQAAIDEEGAEAVAICLDARMDQVFTGYYTRDAQGLANPIRVDELSDPAAISWPAVTAKWFAVGDGWELVAAQKSLAGIVNLETVRPRLPDARFALPLAQRDWNNGLARDASEAQPVYLRDKSAWRKDTL